MHFNHGSRLVWVVVRFTKTSERGITRKIMTSIMCIGLLQSILWFRLLQQTSYFKFLQSESDYNESI
jgi:hypothetical protein